MIRVKFGGANSVTIAPGAEVWSDPLDGDIPAGAIFREFNKHTCASGVLYTLSGNNVDRAALGSSVTDPTSTGSTSGMGGGNFVYGFMESRGYTNKPTGLLLGDSRGAGAGDTDGYGTSAIGALERALDLAGVAYTNLCVSGAALWQVYLSMPAKVKATADRVSFFIASVGINDINAGDSAATLKTNFQSLIAAWNPTGLKPFYSTTVEPYTTSTDAWATEANQTIWDVTKNAVRVQVNLDRMSSNIVGQWGCFDICRFVESSASPGKWLAPGYTGDGLHAKTKGYLQAQLAIPPGFGSIAMV